MHRKQVEGAGCGGGWSERRAREGHGSALEGPGPCGSLFLIMRGDWTHCGYLEIFLYMSRSVAFEW